MKIKNSFASLKLSPMVKAVTWVLIPLAAVLRFVQVKLLVDPATGFYTHGSPLTWIVNLLLIGGAVGCAVYCYLSKESAELRPLPYKNIGMFVLSLIFGIILLLNSIKCLDGFANASAGYGFRSFKELMSTGALPLLFQSVFALLSGIYFIFVAVSYKKGSLLAAKHRFLALAPTAWIAARLLHMFVRKISFMKVSDLFFELIACCCMILFFLAFAQVVSGVYSTGMSWRLIGFGLPAALLMLALQLPRFVFMFIDGGSYLNENHTFSITDLFFGILVCALCFVMLRTPADAEEAPKAEEETPKTEKEPEPEPSPYDDIAPINFGE